MSTNDQLFFALPGSYEEKNGMPYMIQEGQGSNRIQIIYQMEADKRKTYTVLNTGLDAPPRATATAAQVKSSESAIDSAVSQAVFSGQIQNSTTPSQDLQQVIDNAAIESRTTQGLVGLSSGTASYEATYSQPNLSSDQVTATILGQPGLEDLSSIKSLTSVSDPANKPGVSFNKTTVVDGPAVNPYKNINPNRNAASEFYEVIGGSDLSVYLVMEVPLAADLDLPTDAQRKDILTIEMENVLSLGYSTVRERYPVRNMGESNPRSYTRGNRTIAGHLAFNVFTKDVLQYLRSRVAQELQTIEGNIQDTTPSSNQSETLQTELHSYHSTKNALKDKVQLLDDLPTFHILCMGTNENGIFSKFIIKSVSIVDENQYQGTQQPNIINKVSWVAQDIVPMNEVEKWNQSTVITSSCNSIQSSYSRGNYSSKINYNYEVSGSGLLSDLNNSFGGN